MEPWTTLTFWPWLLKPSQTLKLLMWQLEAPQDSSHVTQLILTDLLGFVIGQNLPTAFKKKKQKQKTFYPHAHLGNDDITHVTLLRL